MNPIATFLGSLALVGILCSSAAIGAESREFTNRKDRTSLEVHEYKASVEFIFAGKKAANEYSFEFSGFVRIPESLDIVCIADELKLISVEDERKNSLAKPVPLSRTARSSTRQDFGAIADGQAPAELKATEIKANPYRIKEVVVAATGVMAKKRDEILIDARVEEDSKPVGHNIRMRLSSMKIDRARVAEVTIHYQRPKGNNAAFLEAVYALDEKGKVLGGGRWTKASDIFSDNMLFKGEFGIGAGVNIAKFKCVFVTDYQVVPLEYTVTGIFQE